MQEYIRLTNLLTALKYATPNYHDLQDGYDKGGGTTIPSKPTISVCKAEGIRAILLKWDRQLNLTNFDRYQIQVSAEGATWYSLQFGPDWKETLDAATDWQTEMLVHAGIPHTGDADNPGGRTLYYRVRRVTKESAVSEWSDPVSATTNTVQTGDLAANSIYANNIIASEIAALLLRAAQLWVGYKGTGDRENPDEGDRRIYVDDDEIKFQIYTKGAWSTERQILLGGADGNGNFRPFLACRGLLHTIGDAPEDDPVPAGNIRLFQFDNNRCDQNGVDPWTVTLGSFDYSTSVKWQGTHSMYTTALMLNAWFAGGWQVGDSVTACFMLRIDDNEFGGVDILEWGASSDNDYINIELSPTGTRVLRVVVKKGGTSTTIAAGQLSQSQWHFIGFTYDADTNTAYLRVDNAEYSAQPSGAWGSGTKSIFLTFLGGATYTRYLDDLLFSVDTAMNPDLFFQHVIRARPWTVEYCAEDILLKPASGGRVVIDGPAVIDGGDSIGKITVSTADPSGTPADGDLWLKREA